MKRKTIGAAILIGALVPVPALADPVRLVCTGFQLTWSMEIDTAAGIADGMHATVTSQNIAWHNMINGSDYNLDRASGALKINGSAEFTCRADQKKI